MNSIFTFEFKQASLTPRDRGKRDFFESYSGLRLALRSENRKNPDKILTMEVVVLKNGNNAKNCIYEGKPAELLKKLGDCPCKFLESSWKNAD